MVRKALDIFVSMYVIRNTDLEFLVSHWTTEMHTFVTSWGVPTYPRGRFSNEGVTGLVCPKQRRRRCRC